MSHPAVDALRAAMREVAALPVGEWTGGQAAQLVHDLTEVGRQLEGVRLAGLAVVQASGVWGLDGSQSAAAWLARAERSTKASAGADLKTARMLKDLPSTHAAVVDGTVPPEHAKAITRTCLKTESMRAMLRDPHRGEAFLLDQAGLGLDDFKRFLNAWAYRVDPDAADVTYRESRDDFFVQTAETADGVAVRAFLDPVAGEGFITALRAEIGVPAKTDPRTTPRRMHDALASIISRVLDGGSLGKHASVRPQVVVHVPLATVEAKAGTKGLAPAWLQESRTPIPRSVLDKQLCDCEITRVVFGPDGEVLDVGRSQRTFTGARRRALDARDGGCRWPGCNAPPRQSEGHHQIPWSEGGRTDPREGLLLCWHHHIYTHAHDVQIVGNPAGVLTFYDSDGRLIGTSQPRSAPDGDPLPWDDAA